MDPYDDHSSSTLLSELKSKNEELEKRVAELLLANKALTLQNEEKKKAEEHTLFLASITNNIHDPIISTDNEGNITRWNKAAESLLGWSMEEMIGKRGTEILKIDYLDVTRDLILESLKQKNYWHGEVIYHAKSGRPVNVLITASQLKDTEGNVTGNLALVRDITERKAAEEEIIKANKRFSLIFNLSPVAIAITSMDEGKYIMVNEAFCKITGYRSEELIGKRSVDINIISSDTRAKLISLVTEQGDTTKDIEGTLQRKNGALLDVICRSEIFEHHGLPCFISVLVDISQMKKAEAVLAGLNIELEQKIAERTYALQRSEAQYRTLFSDNPMPMFIMELATYKFLDVNDLALQQYGYSREEFLSLSAFDIRPEEDHARFLQLDLSNDSKNTSYKIGIWKHLKKDGTIIMVDVVAHDIVFEGTKARLVLTKDVTEEKKMQELLLEHQKQLELFSKHSPVALAMLDKDMIYLATSNRWKSDFGLENIDLEGLSHYDMFPEIPEYWKEIHRRCLNGAVEKNDEELFIRQDGSSFWLRWEVHPWYKASGEVGGIIIFSEDITERKLADTNLKESETRFRVLIENNVDIISLTDDTLTPIYQSPSTERLTGWPPEAFKENTDINFFHQDDMIVFQAAVSEAIKTPGVPQQFISRFLHKKGHYIWLEGTVTKLPDDSVVKGFVFNSRDITGRKLSEDQLNQLNQQLREQSTRLLASNEELEQFAFVASHDLQEPLRMVASYLNLLEKRYHDKLDEKSKKYIGFAIDGAKRMRSLILDLLEFSRVGKLEDAKENVDVNELIQEIRSLLAKQIKEKHASIHCLDLPVVYAQKTPLLMVFQNLVSNAMKYTEEGIRADIHISATSFDDHWQFVVKDNGIGIDPEFFDKIFIIFQRLHNRDHYSGTGIGLAVTKKIIEKRGGKIWVESKEGNGSTFYFTVKK